MAKSARLETSRLKTSRLYSTKCLSLRKDWYGLERRGAAQQDEQLGGFTGFAIAADPSCASELRSSRFEIRELEVTNVLRILALGGCVFEARRRWGLEVTNV